MKLGASSALDLFVVQVDFDRTRLSVTLHHVGQLVDEPCYLPQPFRIKDDRKSFCVPQAPPTQDLPTQGPPSQMLDGITVLDFTRVLGLHATRLMADLGARIIKIERPGEGDEMRRAPTSLPGDGDQSTYFARRNACQSIAIDLSSEAGRELIHALVPHVDVAIENFMPGVATSLAVAMRHWCH